MNQTERKIEFERVCNLQPEDLFLLHGIWRRVTKRTEEKLYYKSAIEESEWGGYDSLSANSKQILEVQKAT